MDLPPSTNKFFSTSPRREILYRCLYFFIIFFITIALYIYWQPLRNTSFTYSLVHITVENTAIRLFFRLITILGSEGFFLILLSVIYWSINKFLGFWGLIIMPISIFVTSEIPKDIIKLPRPDVSGVTVTTYTFPSGHASGAVSVWGYLSVSLKKRWFWIFSIVIITLVSISRTMLGYHFLGDVLGGIVTGMVFLLFFFILAVIMVKKNLQIKTSILKFMAIALPFVLSFLPATFAPNFMGYVAGTCLGYLLQRDQLCFDTKGYWKQHMAKMLIGFSVLALIIPGCNYIFHPGIHILKFIQHTLATFWITYVAPLLFLKLRLVERIN